MQFVGSWAAANVRARLGCNADFRETSAHALLKIIAVSALQGMQPAPPCATHRYAQREFCNV